MRIEKAIRILKLVREGEIESISDLSRKIPMAYKNLIPNLKYLEYWGLIEIFYYGKGLRKKIITTEKGKEFILIFKKPEK